MTAYAFNQRANFYSAMVYLSQNNLSLMVGAIPRLPPLGGNPYTQPGLGYSAQQLIDRTADPD